MKIELSVLSVYSVLSVSFYLNPCEIEPGIEAMIQAAPESLNPCYTGMEIERQLAHLVTQSQMS